MYVEQMGKIKRGLHSLRLSISRRLPFKENGVKPHLQTFNQSAKCRGMIFIPDARVTPDDATHNITIHAGPEVFHMKANNAAEFKQWVKALNQFLITLDTTSSDDDDRNLSEAAFEEKSFKSVELLKIKYSLLEKSIKVLKMHSSDLPQSLGSHEAKPFIDHANILNLKAATVLRAAEEFLEASQAEVQRVENLIDHKRDSHFGSSEFNDIYHDANEDFDFTDEPTVMLDGASVMNDQDAEKEDKAQTSKLSLMTAVSSCDSPISPQQPSEIAPRSRRTRIPERPDLPLNLWNIMKNCIGKELSKIPMPVNFSEPLSMLQRVTEDMEYAHLLTEAVAKEPSVQMCYVAAFAVSSYSTTGDRTTKPFNPLLGETYECDRTADLGWRSFTEQVSHHPPAVAHHVEGPGWTLYQDFTMSSRFRGKYLSIVPVGCTHIVFSNGDHYTFRKVITTVHNIIVGKLWIDNHGEMEIKNHKNSQTCHLKFYPYSYFNRDNDKKVTGTVRDGEDVKFTLQGTWDRCIEMADVIKFSGSGDKLKLETANPRIIWSVNPPHENSSKMYGFTKFAIELNEMEAGVAPTDSRLRPDQRLMEEGRWSIANVKKLELEEKQRSRMRKMEERNHEALKAGHTINAYKPLWFQHVEDSLTGTTFHKFTGEYWECKLKGDWTRCPDLF